MPVYAPLQVSATVDAVYVSIVPGDPVSVDVIGFLEVHEWLSKISSKYFIYSFFRPDNLHAKFFSTQYTQ